MARAVGTRIIRKRNAAPRSVGADICVIGSGAAGISAAVEAARGGSRVVLLESRDALRGACPDADRAPGCPGEGPTQKRFG